MMDEGNLLPVYVTDDGSAIRHSAPELTQAIHQLAEKVIARRSPVIDLQGCTIVQEVTGSQLQGLTSTGWKLLAVLNASRLEPVQEREHVPLSPAAVAPGCYGAPGHAQEVTTTRMVPVQHVLYLVGYDGASELAQVNEKLRDAEARCREWDKKLVEERKTHASAAQQLEDAKRRADNHEYAARTERETVEKLRATYQKLEASLGTVRKAIGDREMRRILEEAEGAKS